MQKANRHIQNLLLFGFTLTTMLASAQVQPNIIYIMADDLGYADLSCYGRKEYQTPHLDKLASQGMRFLNAYAAAPVCTPTRAAFMTGRYPARTPVGLKEPLEWSARDSLIGLTPDQISVATLLKRSGYETFLVGKWHLGFLPAFSPNKNGFEEFFGFHGGAIDYTTHNDPKGENALYDNGRPVKQRGYMTDLLKERAVEIISRYHDQPFFLCVMFNAPHWPWQAPGDDAYALGPAEWRAGGSPQIFAAMVMSLDEAVGAIMKALEDEGLADNTVVIFTSDNGGERYSDMGETNGAKPLLKEGGIKVPAFIRWPEKIPANSITEQVAITMDWTATILALAKARQALRIPLDGLNLLPVCMGRKRPIPRTFYWRVFQHNQQKAIRDGNWKYLKDENGEYLYNVYFDRAEKSDLKLTEKQVFERLKQKYGEWEKTVLKPISR